MKPLAFLLTLFCSAQTLAASALIAVAANFTDVTRELVPQFEQATGHKLKVSYGSTGKLYAQIEHGAPFDVFLAADLQRPALAEQSGLAVAGSRFTYALGKLVLWSANPALLVSDPAQSPAANLSALLQQPDIKRIAIANPKTAPYGLAAQQVLAQVGAADALQARLVRGDSIAQTFQFVATGNASAGFIAQSQLHNWSGAPGSVLPIPTDLYRPIRQQAVLLQQGEGNPAAVAFLKFLRGPEAQALIRRYGYEVE